MNHNCTNVADMEICNKYKNFLLCHSRLSVLHNYFDCPTKLFSDLYLAKFLDTSTKPSFPCNIM